jgi:hypothetical protein
MRALEDIIPPEVMRLDKVKFTSEVHPRQITDVITLLHVNRASLRRKQRTFWHIIILTVLCVLIVPGFLLYFSLRSRLRRIIATCQSRNNFPTQNTNERNPTITNPVSSQDKDEPNDEDSKGHTTFTAYPLRQAD